MYLYYSFDKTIAKIKINFIKNEGLQELVSEFKQNERAKEKKGEKNRKDRNLYCVIMLWKIFAIFKLFDLISCIHSHSYKFI